MKKGHNKGRDSEAPTTNWLMTVSHDALKEDTLHECMDSQSTAQNDVVVITSEEFNVIDVSQHNQTSSF